jgi:hypothetical protein
MIEAYLRGLDELLSTSALVQDVEVVRRSIRDSEFEKILHDRYRVLLTNGDLVEMTEGVLEVQGTIEVSKYRHHWQDRTGRLIKRWDNAPPYREIATFPHHLHDGAEDHVVSHVSTSGLEVLQQILEEAVSPKQGR